MKGGAMSASTNFLQIVSAEEELRSRHEDFNKIKFGTLFSFSTVSGFKLDVRYCIAVGPIGNQAWYVVELTERNRREISYQISHRGSCLLTRVGFGEMKCLDILLP